MPQVGDYILSPEVCIERKAIPDLISSLSSGRLYTQAEAMLRYYKRPALLIECEESRPFGLINPNELGSEISPQVSHWPRPRPQAVTPTTPSLPRILTTLSSPPRRRSCRS